MIKVSAIDTTGVTPAYTTDEIAALVATATAEEQEQSSIDDLEYARWKKEHDLDGPMTAQEIEDVARYELAYLA